MFQYMPLHWGQVKGSNVFVVGSGTYRGRITRSRSCVAGAEQVERLIIFKMPSDEKNFINHSELKNG